MAKGYEFFMEEAMYCFSVLTHQQTTGGLGISTKQFILEIEAL